MARRHVHMLSGSYEALSTKTFDKIHLGTTINDDSRRIIITIVQRSCPEIGFWPGLW